MAHVLMVVGSLRGKSLNRQLAHVVEELIGSRAEVSYLHYGDVPHMNQDIEFPTPEPVERARRQVEKADGVWIISPEYNDDVPGVLKNLVDWLSRPYRANDWSSGTSLADKAVTVSGAGARTAAAGARRSLVSILEYVRMRVVGGRGTGVKLGADAMASDVLVLSDEERSRLSVQVDEFLAALPVP